LRTGTNAAPRRRAIRGPSRNPRASKPTITLTFFESEFSIVVEVKMGDEGLEEDWIAKDWIKI